MEKCLFCEIINGSIPSKKIIENEGAICFLDINPKEPGHALIIPKIHSDFFSRTNHVNHAHVNSLAIKYANLIKKSELSPNGFNFISNEGEMAGQEVMHYHLHIIPRYKNENDLSLDNVYEILKKH